MKSVALWFFAVLFFFFSLFVSGVIDSQDGFQYVAVARNIYYKGKPSSPPNENDTFKNAYMPTIVGKDGDTYAFTGLGFSLALVPSVAIADIVYNIYDILPPDRFPLNNDWVILLSASFTNAFFGAFLGVVIYLYLMKIKVPQNKALLIAFISLVATNLFVYTKHMLAHMMFTSFLVCAFYLLKCHFTRDVKSGKNGFLEKFSDKRYIVFSGACLGFVMITYNATYLLTLPVYALYYLMLSKMKINLDYFRRGLINIFYFFIGFLPLLIVHLWFENLRAYGESDTSLASTAYLGGYAKTKLITVPLTAVFDGIWGQLFSPGRSIFLYSPLLILPIIFWTKISKKIIPEVVVLVSIFVIYVAFYSTQYMVGPVGYGVRSMWSGETSWGPRYLVPIIPFGILIIGNIYTKLKKIQKLLVFLPLIVVGMYVQLLGVLVPYQVKFHNMEKKFFINETEFTNYDYINLIPRYSPIINMSKEVYKVISRLPQTIDNGEFNVKFVDGIDFPFDVGSERWRVIEHTGYISMDNSDIDAIKNISIDLINHPIETATASALLTFKFNGVELNEETITLNPAERKSYYFDIDSEMVDSENNILVVQGEYPDYDITKNSRQIIGLIDFRVNGVSQNLESIDVPYVSQLGPAMMDVEYVNWGNFNKDPWKYWDIHTQMFERLPDIWWVRNLFYWDVPHGFIYLIFALNILGLILSANLLKKSVKK